MNLLSKAFGALWRLTRHVARGIAITVSLVTAVFVIRAAMDFYDDVSEPIYGIQRQAMSDKLPPFVISDFDQQLPGPLMKSAVIGLYAYEKQSKKIEFRCSAFVVSNQYAVTAAHCLVDENYNLIKDDIHVHDNDLTDTTIVAKAAVINVRADLAMIIGDFSDFHKFRMNTTTGLIGLKGPFYSCGFPWGATPPICNLFQAKGPYYDKVAGFGFMQPGMSGGPVIDQSTGLVGALNAGVDKGFVVVSPVTGLFGALEIDVQE